MSKIDLKKELRSYAAKSGVFEVVDVPPLRYLMIDGHGDPNTAEYADAVSTIFAVAYKLKFVSKREADRDYVVMPLEALWWADDMASFTTDRDKAQWEWTALNLVPDWITDAHLDAALAGASKSGAPAVARVRLETYDEGRCAQTLHVGSFDDEGPVLDELHHRFIPAEGLMMTGRHHEIYLSDFRRTDPSKLRTILRQPVADDR
ncbi:GyrI-like domain-containing protein [Microbacterium sp. CFBP9034]|uniref:GyrI-like domain-containing protein n=1 Tax=Microbacterium sp. CFBP9034 TaxID=3096540 RepID=UPI002A69BA74|nr:GyrI-like domain-containing protein [Microbacterium sp. CFBP9034]MDY0910673.1 GyrI-like domain-containing protein [Microbacterium sp. CFBP9034]